MSSAASTPEAAPYHLAPLAGGKLPLVIQPRGDDDAGRLADWLGQRPGEVQRLLVQHGALLLRDFRVHDAATFERVARAIAPVLKNDYLGTSPRNALTDYVFSASELPPFYPIPQHIEMSFVKQPPSRLFFWCELPSGGEGGETPLVDFRRVLADLEPAVRARFEQRGVTNIRNYGGPPAAGRRPGRDLWKLKRWDEMFLTTDHDAVLAKARGNGFQATWRKGDRLRLVNTQPATKLHPTTGEPVWFNHSQVFHLSAAAGEYRRIAGKSAALSERIRYRALALFARTMVALKARLQPVEDQAMHCTYGDGSPIPDADMERVRDAIWKNMVVFRWQRGDVVAIDNHAVSHGRMPYHGPRKIAAAWA